MKKTYIAPDAFGVRMACEGVLAVSVGLKDGDGVGNRKPQVDGDGNFFSNRRGDWNDDDEWS